jgi:hypothetical protein
MKKEELIIALKTIIDGIKKDGKNECDGCFIYLTNRDRLATINWIN